jgi:hypothetical protein
MAKMERMYQFRLGDTLYNPIREKAVCECFVFKSMIEGLLF